MLCIRRQPQDVDNTGSVTYPQIAVQGIRHAVAAFKGFLDNDGGKFVTDEKIAAVKQKQKARNNQKHAEADENP